MQCKNLQSATCLTFLIMFCGFTYVNARAKIEEFKLIVTNVTTKISPTMITVVPNTDRLTIYRNVTVQFSCLASGSNGSYAAISHNGFEKNRSTINPGNTQIFVDFSILRTECSHAGRYMCKTGNMKGFSELAIDIVVECLTTKERFYPEDNAKYVAIARGLQGPTLTCTETSLGPFIVLSIQREDGRILSQIENSTLVNYTFGTMQCTDMGTYLCVADSKTMARATTQKLDISVTACPPQICKHKNQVDIEISQPFPFAFQICITKPEGPNMTRISVDDTWIFFGGCHHGICFSYLNRVSRFVQHINLTLNDTSLRDTATKVIKIGTGYNYKNNYVNYSIVFSRKVYNITAEGVIVGASSVYPESPITTTMLIGIAVMAGLFVIVAAFIIYLYRDKIKHFQLKLSKRCYNTGDGLFLGAMPAENSTNNEAKTPTTTAKTVQQVDTTIRESTTTDTIHETRASVIANGQPTLSLPLTSRLPDVAYSHQNGTASHASMPPGNVPANQPLNSPYGNPPYSTPLYGKLPYLNSPYGNRPPDVVFEYPDGRIGHLPAMTDTMYETENGTVTYITRSPDVSVGYSHDPLPAMERRTDDLPTSGPLTNMPYIPDVMLVNMTYNPDGTLSNLKYNPDGTLSSLTYNPDGTMTTLKYSTDGGQGNLPYIHGDKISTLPYNTDGTVVSLPYGLNGAPQQQVHHTQDVYQVTATTDNNNQFTDNDGIVYVTTGNTQVIKKTERIIHEEIRETVEFVNLDVLNVAPKPDVTSEETQNEANRTYEEQHNLHLSR